ncbi:putative amidase C869.01 [Amborella trichopoda]|uniref:putative amidase C869.01 n=1 Tax=Amborella trichopoda TaxID=13333 RepID=UPI0009BCA108|nr:putative amidase C869.01 [Amborella trichopoda]|eukprot:XP_020527438.1 putative amidase C869.01 [Amborella trichopoda]
MGTCSNQIALLHLLVISPSFAFEIKEATVNQIQEAFMRKELTSRDLVEFYLREINALNLLLRAVLEVNPDALDQADRADKEREATYGECAEGLHGIPVLLKGKIATRDRLNTTAGSLALLGSVVPRDAGVVWRLRAAEAIILGKASMSEWAEFRSLEAPMGWIAIGGQPKNPYVLSANPSGSSTGSAISAATYLATVTLSTETDGSIITPSSANSVVGIKPTLGLTSRAGVILISPRQDTVGPICRTVLDAVFVLDEIVGFDQRDKKATIGASKFIPAGGYKQFLKAEGLRGKRLGILREPFFNFSGIFVLAQTFETHFKTLRQKGAILVDNIEISNINVILDVRESGEGLALLYEFKEALNAYLSELLVSPVRTLAYVIAFKIKYLALEKLKEYGQDIFILAESLNRSNSSQVRRAISNLKELSRNGIEKVMREKKLDAILAPANTPVYTILAIGGYPGITVLAGYDEEGVPFGICFGGLRGSEPNLIEIAYSFEQATHIRRPPTFKS